jgi:hypothetical protein
MELGIVKGSEIKKNKDSTTKSLLLQVEIIPDDVRTVELISMSGEDVNPGKGCRVFITDASKGYKIATGITDNLEPESDSGEREIYSTDDPVTEKKAKIKLAANGDIEIDAYGGATLNIKADGNIEINGDADYAVSWTDLDTALQTLVSGINTALGTKKDEAGTPGTLSLDLSTAKIGTVKFP